MKKTQKTLWNTVERSISNEKNVTFKDTNHRAEWSGTIFRVRTYVIC